MRSQYDFGKAKRGPVVRVAKGKTRITIRLDDDLLRWFKGQVHEARGGSYQALINAALHTSAATTRGDLAPGAPRGTEACQLTCVAGRCERRSS